MYPRITHITDVLPFIEDDSAFRVIEKPTGHTFINYNHMGNDVFPPFPSDEELIAKTHDDYDAYCAGKEYERAAARRECRGIAFYTNTGAIASRPFHKFFNAGERDEVAFEKLPFDVDHIVMDKLDGSMIRPLYTDGGFRWGTKMGVTDVGIIAEEFVARNPRYIPYAEHCSIMQRTPIFEFVSRRNRIVVDYAEENLILFVVRDNITGEYLSRDVLEAHCLTYNIPLVKTYAQGSSTSEAADFVAHIRQSKALDEGVVVMWPDRFIKVKTEEYSNLHAAKDKLATERRLIEVVMADQVDDLLPILHQEDRDRLLEFVTQFWAVRDELASYIDINYRLIRNTHDDKKSFALSDWAKQNTHMRSVAFAMWDGKQGTAMDAAMHIIRVGLSSETRWNETKDLWGLDLDWQDTENNE